MTKNKQRRKEHKTRDNDICARESNTDDNARRGRVEAEYMRILHKWRLLPSDVHKKSKEDHMAMIQSMLHRSVDFAITDRRNLWVFMQPMSLDDVARLLHEWITNDLNYHLDNAKRLWAVAYKHHFDQLNDIVTTTLVECSMQPATSAAKDETRKYLETSSYFQAALLSHIIESFYEDCIDVMVGYTRHIKQKLRTEERATRMVKACVARAISNVLHSYRQSEAVVLLSDNTEDESALKALARRERALHERQLRAQHTIQTVFRRTQQQRKTLTRKPIPDTEAESQERLLRIKHAELHAQSLRDQESMRVAELQQRCEMVRLGDRIGRGE